jgi:hypothetical protein
MIATSAFDALSGSDFHKEPIEGTSTCASSWHAGASPGEPKMLGRVFVRHGLSIDFQTSLKFIRAGVAIESSAGHHDEIYGPARRSLRPTVASPHVR